MRLEGDILILEQNTHDCRWCRQGTVPGEKWIKCPKCNGTGRRGSGRCRNCKPSFSIYEYRPGYVEELDYDNPVPCPRWGGLFHNYEDDSITDQVPEEIAYLLEWRVNRIPVDMNWWDSNIGGQLGSCVDYGRHSKQTDAELIAYEQRNTRLPASAITRETPNGLQVAKGIVILCKRDGYTKKPFWED